MPTFAEGTASDSVSHDAGIERGDVTSALAKAGDGAIELHISGTRRTSG
jgi:hypothetical protein